MINKIRRLQLKHRQEGLTIVELSIVIPVAAIIVVFLISILFSQYGSVLAESSRSNLRANGQALLNALQDELLFTIEYGHDLHEDLADPHAPSGGWTYNTTPSTLIINETALDSARVDPDRNIVRERNVACATNDITDNPVAVNNIIYFVEDVPGSDYDRLVKRTLIPSYDYCSVDRTTGDPCQPSSSTCLPNAKETTCPEANVGSGDCTKSDSILSESVVDFRVRYYQENNIQTVFPSAGDKIEIDLVLGERVFGRDVQVEINHTVRKIN